MKAYFDPAKYLRGDADHIESVNGGRDTELSLLDSVTKTVESFQTKLNKP